MIAKQVRFCAVAACVGLAASVALADPNGEPSVANPYGQVDVAPGQFYVGAAGGVQWMTLPDWESGEDGGGASAFEIDGDGTLYGGQLWLGMAVDAGPGENTRIQLEGSYAEGDLDGRQFRPEQDGAVFVTLNGSATVGINGDSVATLDVDVSGWEVGLRALTELPGLVEHLVDQLGGEARTDISPAFTPSLMIFGGAASQDYDANLFSFLPCPDCGENFVRQNVDSWYVGVEAALTGTVNLSPAATLTLGGRVAGLYFDANMDGEDCYDLVTEATPGCQPLVPALSTSVSDGLTAVTYRGGGFVGVSYDFGGASVGIMGTADYVPMADIVNPRAGSDPSHLDLSHEVVYGVRGSIVIQLTAVKDLREAFVAKGRSVWAALQPGIDERGR